MFISFLHRRKHSFTGLLFALSMVVGLLILFASPAHAEHEDFVGHEPS
jgi:hypothetical protein